MWWGQWRSSHLAVLALRQGRQAASGRQNEALHGTQQAKKKKVQQENDLHRSSQNTLKNLKFELLFVVVLDSSAVLRLLFQS